MVFTSTIFVEYISIQQKSWTFKTTNKFLKLHDYFNAFEYPMYLQNVY